MCTQKPAPGHLGQLYAYLPEVGSNQEVLQEVNGHINWATPMQQNVLQHQKEMQDTQSHGETGGAPWMHSTLREASLEKWHNLGYQLHMAFGKRQTTERTEGPVQRQGLAVGWRDGA